MYLFFLSLSHPGYKIILINDHKDSSTKSERNGAASKVGSNVDEADKLVDEEKTYQNERQDDGENS